MKKLRSILPIILIILFELALGIVLLIKPTEFTELVLRVFGIVLLALGAFYIIRFIVMKIKKEDASIIPVIIGVVALGIGIFCTFWPGVLMEAFTKTISVIYGFMLIISGIFKINLFIDSKRAGLADSTISLLSAIFSLVIGVGIIILAFINPIDVAKTYLIISGISLILSAAFDTVAVIFAVKTKKKIEQIANAEN
ncbi:MAG: DUF308 domain-containing protein [Clostridia bacterium]|nr:DUF308 domain-containing protein [Clostridia bacterium]